MAVVFGFKGLQEFVVIDVSVYVDWRWFGISLVTGVRICRCFGLGVVRVSVVFVVANEAIR